MEQKTKKKIADPCDYELNCQVLLIEGTKYRTLFTHKFENRKSWQPPDPAMLQAYIPGTVKSIEVKEGDHVPEGASLLTLEAMKMRNIITAPAEGRIIKIDVEEEQRIPKGYIMIEMEFS